MGQYYIPVVIDGEKKEILYSHDYGNGLKLMEHSWIRNNFVNAVMAHMTEKPVRLVWLGDYSDGCYEAVKGSQYIKSEAQFVELYSRVFGNDVDRSFGKADSLPFDLNPTKVFLVNFDKEEYVSIPEYIDRVNKEFDRKGVEESDRWYVNPLPLLTCVGNGQGGGDYWSEIGADYVGRWAFDRILVTDDPADVPENYWENEALFMEV